MSQWTERGYTGHEHLDKVKLIHMNGRVQDPIVGRMLSPDPVLGDLADPQSLNRYSYVRNNPLGLVDPTGFCESPSDSDSSRCTTRGNQVGEIVITHVPPNAITPEGADRFIDSMQAAEGPSQPSQPTDAQSQTTSPFTPNVDSSRQSEESKAMESSGARDRGRAARPDGTPNQNKKIRSHPTRPGWVIDKTGRDGKKVERPARPGEPGYNGPSANFTPDAATAIVVGAVIVAGIILLPQVTVPALAIGVLAQ